MAIKILANESILFGLLLCVIYGFGSFTFDFYAEAATAGFGVMGEAGGVGMFFIIYNGLFYCIGGSPANTTGQTLWDRPYGIPTLCNYRFIC